MVRKLIAAVDGPVLNSIDLFVVAGEDGTPGKYVLPEQIPTARTRDYAEFVSTGDSAVFQWPDFKDTNGGTTSNEISISSRAHFHLRTDRQVYTCSLITVGPRVFTVSIAGSFMLVVAALHRYIRDCCKLVPS